MPPKRPKFSRYGRMPGISWITEKRIPGPEHDEERLTLYLPGGVLDRADTLAKRAGAQNLQTYCEHLLREAIELEHSREILSETEVNMGPLDGLDGIANDPDFLAEWSASATSPTPAIQDGKASGRPRALASPFRGPDESSGEDDRVSAAAKVVLRHATLLGDDPSTMLATLRRGEVLSPDVARELLQALIDLESETRTATTIDRRLSYALHRLAFEGQVLLTDAWPGLSVDPGTVDALHLVQEGVDRVLSGEDIRYYSERETREDSVWTGDETE
jgi:hypothetical protein